MAKQRGAVRFTGSFANAVGYKSSLAKKSGEVFMREKVTEVKNPRSYAQATQRAKLTPAQRYYNAFRNVLDHARQGLPVGNRNRLAFMADAMKNVVPFVPKGSFELPVNVPYQVSKGALSALDQLTVANYVSAYPVSVQFEMPWYDDLYGGDTKDMPTLAQFSSHLLEANPLLRDGDELTFLLIHGDELGQKTYAEYFSIVLNTTDSITIASTLVPAGINLETNRAAAVGEYGKLSLNPGINDDYILNAALIISRKTTTGWIYTNSVAVPSAHVVDGMDIMDSVIIESYMDAAASLDSDLQLQQADNDTAQQSGPVRSYANETFEVTSTAAQEAGFALNKTKSAVATLRNGSRAVVLMDGTDQLAHWDSASGQFIGITYTTTAQQTPEPVIIDATAWDGNQTIKASEVVAAGATFQG